MVKVPCLRAETIPSSGTYPAIVLFSYINLADSIGCLQIQLKRSINISLASSILTVRRSIKYSTSILLVYFPFVSFSHFSFASIAIVGRIIVTGQILPRPSFCCPRPLISKPLTVLQPIVA